MSSLLVRMPTKQQNPASKRSIAERFASSVSLRQIRYFIAVAESGKISAAAAMVGISPSVVTEAIATLEALSGTSLFTRLPRGLELTYEGHRLLAHARNVLSAVEAAGAAIVRPESDITGSISLGATITVMGYFIAPFLARFKRIYPNVEINVVEAQRPEIERGLLDGRLDIAVMLTSNLSERHRLLAHTLVSSMRRLWLPAQHPFLYRDVVTLADIAPLPYVQLLIDDAEASTANYWRKHGGAPNVVVRTESVEAVRSLIANRQGVTILSDMMYRTWSLEGDRIEVREVDADIPMMTTGVVWPRDRPLSTAAETFLGFCRMDSDLLRSQAHRTMPPPSA
ncbi:LysR family transcriptional regulator [Rhodopseudomonas sp.]|uniref:LysR family transcriptional regulator n=1 Tax=Rhodopseudomonas sp. TaxID=1078 RepID=UPI003B3B49A5